MLRMQFKLPITERSGLGIAWDDEVPPTYEDVRTLSPPNYQDQSVNITPTLGASSVQERSTPNVLYGRGETPIVGSFGLQGQNQQKLGWYDGQHARTFYIDQISNTSVHTTIFVGNQLVMPLLHSLQ